MSKLTKYALFTTLITFLFILYHHRDAIETNTSKYIYTNNFHFPTKKKNYFDATAKLSINTVVYPGDPTLKIKPIYNIGKNSVFGLSNISLSNHMGTHIDFPAHVIKKGKTSSNYTINDLIGFGVIIDVPLTAKSISKEFVLSQEIEKHSIVLFRTKNSQISKKSSLVKNYVYLEPDAASVLVKKHVKIVGIDYISIDSIENEDLPAHKVLLKNNILIVENLELLKIKPGKAIIHISPLNITGMDGLPARVIIERDIIT